MRRVLFALGAAVLSAALAWSIEIGGLQRGSTKVKVYLPVEQRLKNVGGSDGAGLCVFSSISMAARYQNVPALADLQIWMRSKPGGGYPQKVDQMIARYCQEQGVAKPDYIQYEGTDPALVRAAVESGRVACVTYDGRDPHYRSHVEHMVCVVAYDDSWVVVLDNNFIEDAQLVWLTPAEFKSRWVGQGGRDRQGWLVVLLNAGWPPDPDK